jgi:hypothetical protein
VPALEHAEFDYSDADIEFEACAREIPTVNFSVIAPVNPCGGNDSRILLRGILEITSRKRLVYEYWDFRLE